MRMAQQKDRRPLLSMSQGGLLSLSSAFRVSIRVLTVVIVVGCRFQGYAQENHSLLQIEELLEELTEDNEERDWEEELEELEQYRQNPINLNTATRSQLEQLPFLSALQVEHIQEYIYRHGEMQSIYELLLVPGISKRTIQRILPFVCVHSSPPQKKAPSWKRMMKYGKQELSTRFDLPLYTRKGYERTYLGPPVYHALRYRFHYSDYLQVGVTAEKDAGEPMFARHERKGYDYYSPYLLLKERGILKTLAVGNYQLSFGQGLVMCGDFRMGKSYSMATADYHSNGIRKHSSTDEYNYFRGMAATIEPLHGVQVSAFYSHRKMDGTIKEGEITSIYKSGLHRSKSEADKQGSFVLQLTGANLSYQKKSIHAGITGTYYFFNRPYEPSLNKYARYNLHGQSFFNIGADYRIHIGRLTWSGETATGRKGYALFNQLDWQPQADYRLMLIHRLYSHTYWNLFARSFSEGSTPQNENGWYLASELTPLPDWRFFVSIDLFSFPWWRYRISKPSQGTDCRLKATYSPREHLDISLSYQYKQKERDITGTGGKQTTTTRQHKVRLKMNCQSGEWLIKSSADYTGFCQAGVKNEKGNSWNHGYQLTQSAEYRFPFRLSASLQATWFHTDNYDSRVYVGEKGMLNTFYTPSYSGHGFRHTFLVRYEPNRHLLFLVKLGQTLYLDRNEIGSGNDLIRSNRKTDLQMQLRIRI